MQKEILTKEKLKNELIKCLLYDIRDLLCLFFASIPILILILYLCIVIKSSIPNFIIFFPIIFVFLIFFFCSITLVNLCIYLNYVKTDNYKIEIDTCVQKKEIFDKWGLYAFKNHIWVYKNRPYRIFFLNYGEYAIRHGKNYFCSQFYKMEAKGVYRYTSEGDKFYLIIIKNKVILLAYNTKLFELK